MTLRIKIELDNAAFSEGGANEIERVLTAMCRRLPEPLAADTLPLFDFNGNKVGEAKITGRSVV
jgi:hypothetical protein